MQGKQKGSSAAHSKLLKESLIELGKRFKTTIAFRNEVGEGWFFPPWTKFFEKENARYLKYGLAPDTPDIISFESVVITPEMVGKKIAVFAGYEIKTGNAVQTVGQKNCEKILLEAGGSYKLVRSLEDL